MNTAVIYRSDVTLDGIDFRGTTVFVQANNVTLQNSRFDASVGTAAVVGYAGFSGLTIDHSTFDGLKLDKVYHDFVLARGTDTTITNNVFLNAPSDAIYIESGRVAGNYIAGGGYQTNAHADAIWIGRTTGAVTIEHNVIDWRSSADARVETNEAIRITAENGNVSNVNVRNNVLLGGSYTVSVTDTANDKGNITNVNVSNNVVDEGKWGNLFFQDRPGDLVYRGNAPIGLSNSDFGLQAAGPKLSVLAAGARVVEGNGGADALAGGTGREFFQGRGGQDWISAGGGADLIRGDAGRDYLTGGEGADVFVYDSFDVGRDLIADFTHGQDRLHFADLPGSPNAVAEWSWMGQERFSGDTWQFRSETTANGNTMLQLDRDGDMRADLEVEFQGRHTFTQADFNLGAEPVAQAAPVSSPGAVENVKVTVPPPVEQTTIRGTAGSDILNGSGKNERIEGGLGNDSIKAGAGDDVVVGSAGKDIIFTGAGRDRIVYEAASDSLSSTRDYIGDFTRGEDVLDLSAIDASAKTGRDDAFTWVDAAAFSGHAGELRYALGSASTLVQGDLNGDRVADIVIELAGRHVLTAGDFFL